MTLPYIAVISLASVTAIHGNKAPPPHQTLDLPCGIGTQSADPPLGDAIPSGYQNNFNDVAFTEVSNVAKYLELHGTRFSGPGGRDFRVAIDRTTKTLLIDEAPSGHQRRGPLIIVLRSGSIPDAHFLAQIERENLPLPFAVPFGEHGYEVGLLIEQLTHRDDVAAWSDSSCGETHEAVRSQTVDIIYDFRLDRIEAIEYLLLKQP